MKQRYTIEIDAPPAHVFELIEDPERLMQWLPGLVENERLKGHGVGSTFRQVYLEHGRRMEMFGEVTAYQSGRRLACEIRGPIFDLTVDYSLEDLDGRTRLTQDSAVRMKGLLMRAIGTLLSPLMRKAQLRQRDESFGRLKRLAETRDR